LRIEKKLAGILLKDGIISSEEVGIVEYGLENLGSSLLGMSITLLIGYCFDFLWGSFLLWILIVPLRKNAGGFHAETKARCLLFSSAMLLTSIICFGQIKWSEAVYIGAAVCSFLAVFFMAPVGNDNKHLDQGHLSLMQHQFGWRGKDEHGKNRAEKSILLQVLLGGLRNFVGTARHRQQRLSAAALCRY